MGKYVCSLCEKNFSRQSSLSRHTTTVCNKRTFECSCGLEFTRGDNLHQHQKTCKANAKIEQLNVDNQKLFLENKELSSEIKDLSSENKELRARPTVINNYNIINVVARGLIEHVDENIIHSAMIEELTTSDYKITTLIDVQKIVFNVLVKRVTSSNKRTRNMVYNIMKKLVYRDVSVTEQVMIGIRKALIPEYQRQYDNRPKRRSRKDHGKIQDDMDIWYALLMDKPVQFMDPILRKLHIQNYISIGDDGVEYCVPAQITYKDPYLVLDDDSGIDSGIDSGNNDSGNCGNNDDDIFID